MDTSGRSRTGVLTLAMLLATVGTVVAFAPSGTLAAPAVEAGSLGKPAGKSPYQKVCAGPRRPDEMECFALVQTVDQRSDAVQPHAGHGGLSPADLWSAYQLPSAEGGVGETVAIVSAYDNPHVEEDLAVYRAEYGLPPCTTENGCFRKVNQDGAATPQPTADSSWAAETALDVQMVSAVCPNCQILLVEANSAGAGDLMAGIESAVALGAKFISNSYGTNERDALSEFGARLNQPGIAMTFASGDSGYGVSFPASSPYVTAVGGTTLERASNGRGWTESVWSGAGSGCSPRESKPPFQSDTGCENRTVADVSAVADPKTGVAVYNTFGYNASGWRVFGGTSAAAPMIAAIYALAGVPLPGTYPNSYPYFSPSALFDVTFGSNGSCSTDYLCKGRVGYDGPTGLGTPNGVAAFRPIREYGAISGTITDGATKRPLAGVKVTADKAGAVTDQAGRYTMRLPTGTYEVRAATYGYRTKIASGVAVAGGDPTRLDFALNSVPKATISGTVRDGGGQGWPIYAKITVADVPGAPIFTDPVTGHYEVSLPSGFDYRLRVTSNYDGYQDKAVTVQLGDENVTQDVDLSSENLYCSGVGYRAKDSGVSEPFDGEAAPGGWSVVNRASGGGWTFTDPGKRGNQTGGAGGFVLVDSDFSGEGQSQDSELRSPVLDFRDEDKPVVMFRNDYRGNTDKSPSTADVDLSFDGGRTWETVWHHASDSARGPGTQRVTIPQAAHEASVQVRFHYVGSYDWWWQLDDVLIGHRDCVPTPGGLVVGEVTDSDGASVTGATVATADEPAASAVTVATPEDPALGEGFYWMYSGQVGSRQYTASKPRYAAQTRAVETRDHTATRADFALPAGRLTVTPTNPAVTLAQGESVTVPITVHNDGAAPATVRTDERAGTASPMLAAGSGPAARRIAGVFDKHRLARPGSAGGERPTARALAATAWTDVTPYPSPIVDNLVAAYKGKIYSVGGVNDNWDIVRGGQIYDPISGSWSPMARMATARELPSGDFLDDRLYVVGGWGNDGNTITSVEVYDPYTNTWTAGPSVPEAFAGAAHAVLGGKLYLVGGCGAMTCDSKKVYTFDPGTGRWSRAADYPLAVTLAACGVLGDQLYCAGGGNDDTDYVKGFRYQPATNTWTRIADLPIRLWGMAYGAANGKLVVSSGVTHGETEQELTNQGFAYDPASNAWTPIPNVNHESFRMGSACGFYKVGGSEGYWELMADVERLPGFDQCGDRDTDVSWLSMDKTEFTVAPGESVTVTATLSAASVAISQPGTYTARLAFVADTPTEVRPIELTMNVTPAPGASAPGVPGLPSRPGGPARPR